MTTTYYPPLIYKDAAHQPAGSDEAVDPQFIPVSAVPENQVRALSDGLYAGPFTSAPVYYVSATDGVDDPSGGTKTSPFKTLAYCQARINALYQGMFNGSVTIALKAGSTYDTDVTSPFYCYGHVTYTFWGDPLYGDFDSPKVSGTTLPCLMADLNRPVINAVQQAGTTGGLAGVVLIANTMEAPASCTFAGVRIQLPSGTHVTGYVDFVTAINYTQGSVRLLGSIVDMIDTSSTYGFFGIETTAKGRMHQFASQFLVNGAQVVSGASVSALTARNNFLKFYPDFFGNDQRGHSINAGSPGTGILELNWSDVVSATVSAGKSNLGTYPLLNDTGFGLTNYFLNLNRDQQSRPLNVVSGRLF